MIRRIAENEDRLLSGTLATEMKNVTSIILADQNLVVWRDLCIAGTKVRLSKQKRKEQKYESDRPLCRFGR